MSLLELPALPQGPGAFPGRGGLPSLFCAGRLPGLKSSPWHLSNEAVEDSNFLGMKNQEQNLPCYLSHTNGLHPWGEEAE